MKKQVRKAIEKIALSYKNRPNEWNFDSSIIFTTVTHNNLPIKIELGILKTSCMLYLDNYFCELNEAENEILDKIFVPLINAHESKRTEKFQEKRKISLQKTLKTITQKL